MKGVLHDAKLGPRASMARRLRRLSAQLRSEARTFAPCSPPMVRRAHA